MVGGHWAAGRPPPRFGGGGGVGGGGVILLPPPPLGLPVAVGEEEGEEEERCIWPAAEGAREEDEGESRREEEEGGVDGGFGFCLSPDLGRAEEGEAEVVAFEAAAEPGRPEGAKGEGGDWDWDELEVVGEEHPQ